MTDLANRKFRHERKLHYSDFRIIIRFSYPAKYIFSTTLAGCIENTVQIYLEDGWQGVVNTENTRKKVEYSH